MSLVIKDVSTVPQPDGWKYHVSQTNYNVITRNFTLLYPTILEHCKGNNVTAPSQQDVIDQMCQNLWLECYDSETRQPLINNFIRELPRPPQFGCCG